MAWLAWHNSGVGVRIDVNVPIKTGTGSVALVWPWESRPLPPAQPRLALAVFQGAL
eukprot:CAMPEP_0202870274 /NCGR_PEP_ID=MMETSP1391-20130828/15207_1 /ASSEMBLY_ACC=CAM_ASM_000867 /TAXON_ID=1034604 /ORGANISM="Chlamydomonas leiostraca, Strain SAG 11-49" /LENGTH=55 /DNA_ID=CAMNT_0049550797 /DNA_START=287 /DNA_END=454 /DNA_ORIENTATION=+